MLIYSLFALLACLPASTGAGNGLDHDNMKDVLGAIEASGYPIFLHPHYGVCVCMCVCDNIVITITVSCN